MKAVVKKNDFYSCDSCKITSDTKERMIPCPRGGCEAVVIGETTVTAKTKMKSKLSEKQRAVVKELSKYPNEMVMYDGWLTGGYGIRFDMRTVRALKNKKIVNANGKLTGQ